MTGSLLIKNVWLAAGDAAPLRKVNCLVGKDGNIAALEKEFSACAAEVRLDGRGLILAPGFIDAHGHSDISALAAPECFSKVSQGVTSEVCGNCGLSAFPVTPENRSHLQELYSNYGVDISWNSCQEYLDFCRSSHCSMSTVPLCGHNTLRAAVRNYGEGETDRGEIEKMCSLLDRELSAGAAGLSFGLLYTPGIFAGSEEICALMRIVAKHGKVCAAHLRSEGDKLVESVQEMIQLSLDSGLKHFHFSHLKTAGEENFGKIDKVFELFDEARHKGVEITCDRYPYIESMTQLSVALPGAWKKMDDVKLKKTLESAEEKIALIAQLRAAKSEEYWQRCRIVNTAHPRFAPYRGKCIADIPGDVVENAVEMLAFDPVNCQAAFATMSEENMRNIIAQPFCVAGSDGNALPSDGRFGKTHPRSFGAVAGFLRISLDMGISIEESVSKVSGKTASIFTLEDRGVVAPGKVGDLVLFDPDSVDSKADFLAPETPAEGIVTVIKNGEIIYN